jgi:hypothetical protein
MRIHPPFGGRSLYIYFSKSFLDGGRCWVCVLFVWVAYSLQRAALFVRFRAFVSSIVVMIVDTILARQSLLFSCEISIFSCGRERAQEEAREDEKAERISIARYFTTLFVFL